MPLIGFVCPDTEERKTFEECFKCDHECLPLSIREAIVREHEKNIHKGDYVSATFLLLCMRKSYLERMIPYYDYAEKQYYSLRGTLLHRLLEGEREGVLKEKIFSQEICGTKLSGQVDEYDVEKEELTDWKTYGDKGMPWVKKDGAKEEHIWQVNIYRWLLEKAGYPVRTMRIVYLSMMDIVVTGKMHVDRIFRKRSPKDTPTLIRKELTGRQNIKEEDEYLMTYHTPEIPEISNTEIEEFLEEKIPIAVKAFSEGKIPPPIDSEQNHWLCDYCSFKNECEITEENKIAEINELQEITLLDRALR